MILRRRSKPPKHLFRASRLVPATLLLLAAAGCSTSALSDRTTSAEPNYVVTVTPESGDTRASLEQRYSGPIIAWEPGVYAVIGRDAGLTTQNLTYDTVEPNEKAFKLGVNQNSAINSSGTSRLWAGGKTRLWAGGSDVEIWSEGKTRLWAGGEFTWMPENTAKWQLIGLEGAQTIATNLGHGVKVAVIDTGVDLQHPALVDALAPALQWYDFVGGDVIPQEEGTFDHNGYGHGTNVAGIIRQIAPRATILPIRALDANGEGTVASVTAAIQWAVDQKAQIINLSLGSVKNVKAIETAVLNAQRQGVIVVSSVGNTNDSAITYPAAKADKEGLQVNVTSLSNSDVKSPFANFATVVEMAAPGEAVFGPAPELMMAAWSGTSQATPMAAGALALALGEHGKFKTITALTDNLLTSGANHYNSGNAKFVGKLGYSRLNIEVYLKAVLK